jgi:hypothetical protein
VCPFRTKVSVFGFVVGEGVVCSGVVVGGGEARRAGVERMGSPSTTAAETRCCITARSTPSSSATGRRRWNCPPARSRKREHQFGVAQGAQPETTAFAEGIQRVRHHRVVPAGAAAIDLPLHCVRARPLARTRRRPPTCHGRTPAPAQRTARLRGVRTEYAWKGPSGPVSAGHETPSVHCVQSRRRGVNSAHAYKRPASTWNARIWDASCMTVR